MNWTTTPPTEPGMYLWRRKKDADKPWEWCGVALVGDGKGNWRIYAALQNRYPHAYAHAATARSLRGEWFGPVPQ